MCIRDSYTSVDVPRWGGTLKRCFVQNNTYIVRPYDPRVELNGWEHLADIYLSYNVHRPLTTFRDRRYWTTGYAHHRYTLWLSQQKAIFAAFSRKDQGSPIGYISVDFDDTFQIFELGVMQGHDEARMSLIDTTIQAALQKGYSLSLIHIFPDNNVGTRSACADDYSLRTHHSVLAL